MASDVVSLWNSAGDAAPNPRSPRSPPGPLPLSLVLAESHSHRKRPHSHPSTRTSQTTYCLNRNHPPLPIHPTQTTHSKWSRQVELPFLPRTSTIPTCPTLTMARSLPTPLHPVSTDVLRLPPLTPLDMPSRVYLGSPRASEPLYRLGHDITNTSTGCRCSQGRLLRHRCHHLHPGGRGSPRHCLWRRELILADLSHSGRCPVVASLDPMTRGPNGPSTPRLGTPELTVQIKNLSANAERGFHVQ